MEESNQINIVLVDDQAIVRAAFKSLLESVERFQVVGDAGEARKGIELVGELRPHVVILDITMAGMSGLDAVAPIKKASPKTQVLMASQHEGMKFVQQALQAGADGYLSKDSEPGELALARREHGERGGSIGMGDFAADGASHEAAGDLGRQV